MSKKKKPPAWGTIVGILGIVFGLSGMLSSACEIALPYMLAMQQQMMESMRENIDDTDSAIDPAEECETTESNQDEAELECLDTEEIAETQVEVDEVFDTMIDMMKVPAWYKDWALINGGLGLILGAGYLLASIFLLLLRPGAPTLFMVIAGLSICRGGLAVAIVASAFSLMLFWSGVMAVVGLLIDVVLHYRGRGFRPFGVCEAGQVADLSPESSSLQLLNPYFDPARQGGFVVVAHTLQINGKVLQIERDQTFTEQLFRNDRRNRRSLSPRIRGLHEIRVRTGVLAGVFLHRNVVAGHCAGLERVEKTHRIQYRLRQVRPFLQQKVWVPVLR